MKAGEMVRRLLAEHDLSVPREVASAMRFALANGASPAILEALRYRMKRARETLSPQDEQIIEWARASRPT